MSEPMQSDFYDSFCLRPDLEVTAGTQMVGDIDMRGTTKRIKGAVNTILWAR